MSAVGIAELGSAADSSSESQSAVAPPRSSLLIAAAAAGGLLAAVILLVQPTALAAARGSASALATSPPALGLPTSPSPSPSPSSPVAVAFNGTAAVGALFTVTKGKLEHFCTAAVVQSPHGNLAITAAHCMQGRRLGANSTVTFAPGYHDGKFPYGKWLVRSEFVDGNWTRHQDANDDFAFLLVGKAGHRIQRHTGGEKLEINEPLPQDAEVIGYPDAVDLPVKCTAPAKRLHRKGYRQMVFVCDGFTNGTSGGPFLIHVSRKTGRGGVFGVIGGYQQGGNTSRVSYSARFQRNVADLFKQASA